MLRKPRKRRVPALKFTKARGIGWHVSFRDSETGTPRKQRFGMLSREAAEQAYHEWVSSHLRGQTPTLKPKRRKKLDLQAAEAKPREKGVSAEMLPGSLLHITSGLCGMKSPVFATAMKSAVREVSAAKCTTSERHTHKRFFSSSTRGMAKEQLAACFSQI